jgi:hypothetical protein
MASVQRRAASPLCPVPAARDPHADTWNWLRSITAAQCHGRRLVTDEWLHLWTPWKSHTPCHCSSSGRFRPCPSALFAIVEARDAPLETLAERRGPAAVYNCAPCPVLPGHIAESRCSLTFRQSRRLKLLYFVFDHHEIPAA